MLDDRPYYSEGGASTAFYDVLTAADRALDGDVDLYASLIPPGGSVLELGSGTGRISEALARLGFDVVGLELSEAMLAQAVAKQPPGVRLSYVQGDMRWFRLGRTFDAVICPYYALAHLEPGPSWRLVLQHVIGHLAPGGVASFHMPVAAQMAAPAPPAGHLVFQADALAVFMAGKRFDPASGRMDLLLDYAPEGQERHRERLTLYAGDLAPYAAEAGLTPAREPVALGSAGFVEVYRLS